MQRYRQQLNIVLGLVALLWTSSAAAQDRVSVRADVFFYGAHMPLMLGIVDGIYNKHGIEATFTPGRGSATTIQTVANMSPKLRWNPEDCGELTRTDAWQQCVGIQTLRARSHAPSIS